jgi:amidohydrolase
MHDWQQQLWDFVDRRTGEIIALRRHLHQFPEPSGEELETSRHLYEQLTAHGIQAQLPHQGRGVVANSGDQSSPRRIALRGDIDALLLDDQKQVEYHSRVAGVMHACGHDAHAACAYGAAVALQELAEAGGLPCPVTWRAIFQPAEESATGASEMIAAGALADVHNIFSLHVDPTRPAGTIGVRPHTFTAHCDGMRIEIEGVASHSARPHESKDAIAAAAQFISALYQFVPRGIDSQDSCVVAITQVHGGSSSNVIPQQVHLSGMVRSLGRDIRNHAVGQVAHLAEAVGSMTGTTIHVDFGVHLPGVENDPELTDLVANIAGAMLGTDRVQWIERPSMGGEDFAFYLEHVPGVMFRLGCARDITPASGLHTPLFDIDERCLAIGAKILATAAVEASML